MAAICALLLFACASSATAEAIPPAGWRIASLGADMLAHVEAPGRVRYFFRQNDLWKTAAVTIEAPALVPGAALALVPPEGENLPRVLTVAAHGRLVEVVPRAERGDVREAAALHFPPGGDFALAKSGSRSLLFAVDRQGVLWELDRDSGAQAPVEEHPDRLVPGGAVRAMPDEGHELFLVDRRGNIVSYVRDPVVRWKGPRLIGMEFVPGADVAIWRRPDGGREQQLASINERGELFAGRLEPTGWRLEIAPGWVLPPGSPVAVDHTPVNMRLGAVNPRGTLQEMHLLNTEWRERMIADGFARNSSILMRHGARMAQGIDAAGNLLVFRNVEEVWSGEIVPPDSGRKPALVVRREWQTGAPLESVEIELANSSREEVTVRLIDRRTPAAPREFSLAPAASTKVRVDRDSGGALRDILGRTLPEGVQVNEPHDDATGPQSLYDVEVHALRDGIAYIDLRHKSWPPLRSREKMRVCLGRFSLPAGDRLSAGAKVDLLDAAGAGVMSK